MDGVTLLRRARAAGLSVTRCDRKLKIVGPRSASALAEELLASKADVLAELALEDSQRPGAKCDLCERLHPTARPLIPSYWGEVLCQSCCVVLANAHDVANSWPPLPPSWKRDPDDLAEQTAPAMDASDADPFHKGL